MFSVLTAEAVPSTIKLPVTVTLFADKSPMVYIIIREAAVLVSNP